MKAIVMKQSTFFLIRIGLESAGIRIATEILFRRPIIVNVIFKSFSNDLNDPTIHNSALAHTKPAGYIGIWILTRCPANTREKQAGSPNIIPKCIIKAGRAWL